MAKIDKRCLFCSSKRIKNKGRLVSLSPACSNPGWLFECSNCGIFWVDNPFRKKQETKIYDQSYHFYPRSFLSIFISFYNSVDVKLDYRLISRYKKEGRILDIGAGRGDLLSNFPAEKWDRWIFDPYLSGKVLLRNKVKIKSHINDYPKLDMYENNFFDVIILRNVIEHTRDFAGLISNSYRLLKIGGIIFVRTPNMDSMDYKIFKNNWCVLNMIDHLVFFKKRTLVKILEKTDFKIILDSLITLPSPLSLYRSTKINLPKPAAILISFLYAVFSLIKNDEKDIRIIAEKYPIER